MATLCNETMLPFTLYFEDRNNFHYEVTEVWKYRDQIRLDQLPILKENAKIGIRFYADTEEVFDSQSICKIQTNRYDELDEQEVYIKSLSETDDTIDWIYDNARNEDFPWRMGVYIFELVYKEKKYVGGINVLPHHLNQRQVEQIHNYLNKQVEGIIYDFVYSNQAPSETNHTLQKHWYYDYARQLSEHYHEFMFAMTALTKHPKDLIKPEYHISMKPGKLDRKSIRWSQSNKGIAKNSGNFHQSYQLVKKKVNHYDSKDNQWIKNILLLWKRDISEVYRYIKKDEKLLWNMKKEQQVQLEEYLRKKANLFKKRDVGENTKKDINSRILMAEKEINLLSKQKGILDNWLELLHRMENKLVFFLNHTYLSNVIRGRRKPVLKNIHYFRIDSLYEELKSVRENGSGDNHLNSILKPTWQIYEYFCLLKVINLLQSSGYNLVQGINEDVLKSYFEYGIQSGTKFVLENKERVIHVWYDHYHAHSLQQALSRGESFYIHDPKKKPDIKVDAFEKTSDGLWLRGSLILDAKFSKMKHIYNESYINRTTEQLTGYYSFFYHGKSLTQGTCVNQVICLYAGDDANNIWEERQPITFIKLRPSYNGEETDVTGESELLQVLQAL